MIPNVCITWATREAACKYCPESIKVATPIVTVFFWNKGSDGHRWNNKFYYHPDCWIAQGLDYLRMNPYVATKRGRERSKLNDEDRRQRYLLLRRKASLDQRKKALEDTEITKLSHLDAKIVELAVEIDKVGGIPRRWAECLIK